MVAKNGEIVLLKIKKINMNGRVLVECPFMLIIYKKKVFEPWDGKSTMNLRLDLGSESISSQLAACQFMLVTSFL